MGGLKLDVNKLLKDSYDAISTGHVPFWAVFALIALVMSPWIVPAISRAVAEQRTLSHKREANLLKIRNSLADRGRKPKPPAG